MEKLYVQISLLVPFLLCLIFGQIDGKTVSLALTVGGSAMSGNAASSQIGSEIIIRCNFDSPLSRSDVPSVYYQMGTEDPERVTTEIREGKWLEDTNYNTTFDVASPSNQYIQFRIISARVTDSGMYECRWTTKPTADLSEVVSRESVTITILAPTQRVEFLGTTDGILTTTDGAELDVSCKAVGGSQPEMTLSIGTNAPLSMSVVQEITEANINTYKGTVQRQVFTTPMNGLTAVCTAVVEGLDEKQAEAEIFIRFDPIINCDKTEVDIDIERTTNLRVGCTVTGNPLPTRQGIEWITKSEHANQVRLNNENNFDGGIAGFSSTVTINENSVSVELNVVVQENKIPDSITLFVSGTEQQITFSRKEKSINGSSRTIGIYSTLSFLLSITLLTL